MSNMISSEKVFQEPTVMSGKLQDTSQATTMSMNTFQRLKLALRVGNYRAEFPIGTEIDDPWTDTSIGETYSMPWTVVHYGIMCCADGKEHFGAVLFRRVAPTFGMEFDAPEPDSPDELRREYGNNRYAFSNIAQWQNSRKPAGKWFKKQHEYDAPPEMAKTKDGYLCGCSQELLEVLNEQQPVRLEIPAIDDKGEKITDCFTGHIFLPSPKNVFEHNNTKGDETWEFFRGITWLESERRRIVRDVAGDARYWRLRSADRISAYRNGCVTSSGNYDYYSFEYSRIRIAPACVFIQAD